MIVSFLYGLRCAIRNLLFHSRRTSLVAIVTLALGVSSSTIIFSLIDSILVNPFPYKDASRLESFSILNQSGRQDRFPVSAFLDFTEQNHVFEDMIGLSISPEMRYRRDNETQEFFGGWVSPNTFDVLGVKPLLGRPINLEDGNPGSPPVFAMSYQLWTRLFNRDPNILGHAVTLSGTPRTLVAIMPPRFRFGNCEVWIPISFDRNTSIPQFANEPTEVWMVGHLRRGVSPQTAAEDLNSIAQRLGKAFPQYFPDQFKLVMRSLMTDSVGHFKVTIFGLMAAVTMLLLIACTNVANLLLAHATAREKEIAIRASLGASRARLIRQLLIESVLLATACGVAGVALAAMGLRAVKAMIPSDTVPSEVVISLNPGALLFAVGVSVVATVLCGLAPAIHLLGGRLEAKLRGSVIGANAGLRHGRLRFLLVIGEVALSIVLLVGSGLILRSLFALEKVDLGFEPRNVLWLRLSLPEGRYDTAD